MDPTLVATEIDLRILDELGALAIIILYILKFLAERRK